MKAILLAAGMGTRLRPLTRSVPKCLVPVAGKPVIQHNIEWLRGQGVTDLAVNLHYEPDVVRAFLGSGEGLGVSVRYSYEAELMGTAGAVERLREWLDDEDFLVVYADNILGCRIASLLTVHENLRATLTMALYWREDVSASGVADIDDRGRVHAFIEKPRPGATGSHWINAGLLCCSPRVLRFIPPGEFSDFGRDIVPALIAVGETVGGSRMSPSETLYWIDTPADLEKARAALAACVDSP